MKGYLSVLAMLTVILGAFSIAYADMDIDFGDPNSGAPAPIPDITATVGDILTFHVHGNHDVTIYPVDGSTQHSDIDQRIRPGMDYILIDGVGNQIVNTVNRDAEHPNIIEDHLTSTVSLLATKPGDADPGVLDADLALTVQARFVRPGLYLVYCGVKSHLDLGMYGLVNILPSP